LAVAEKYLVVIAGPTAVGKTGLSIELAKHFNAPVLSADSRQLYKELKLGTARPAEDELQGVPYYFLGNKSIHELMGAGHYEKEAIVLLNKLFKEHNIVFLCGGSGLYINALLYGVDEFEEIPSSYREKLMQEWKETGLEALKEELKQCDPAYYKEVDLNNVQRVIRALEVCRYTGKAFSDFRKQHKAVRNFTPIKILLNTTREELYDKINTRVDEMMTNGLLEEVKSLIPYKNNNALKTVGYKELFEYIDGFCSLQEAVNKIKQHSRNYAKRQLTWFKNQDTYEVFKPEDKEKIIAYIDVITSQNF